MYIIAKCVLGSRGYGLATENSDIDRRFVFLNTDLNYIIGLDKHEHQVDQKKNDSVGYEIRRFLQLLKKTNTQVVEMLFHQEWEFLDGNFEKEVLNRRNKLLDTKHMFKSLMGYINRERRLLTGERSGRLGSKRKESLDRYGYSYKNLVQYLRLCYCGVVFINHGYYPVNIRNFDPSFADFLMEIKTSPDKFDLELAREMVDKWEEKLKLAFEHRDVSRDFKFNSQTANDIIYNFYYPVLKQYDRSN